MKKNLAVLMSLLMPGLFFLTLYRHAINVPSYDDYAATLIFIKNHFYNNDDTLGKIRSLFFPHGEHYIVVSRFSAVVAYVFTGTINFTALVWYQNLYLIGVVAMVIAIIRQQNLPLFPLLIPVAVFLFSLSFWQVSLYYWGGIQYYAVFFFAILSLYYLNKTESGAWFYFLLSILFGTLAILSFGNGILVLPLGVFMLAAQKRVRYLWIWTAFSLLCVVLFLSGFHSSFGSKPAFNPVWMGRLFFTFLGSFLYVSPDNVSYKYANIIVCMLVGAGVFFLWLRLLFNGYAWRNPLLYCLLSLPILTGLLIALARFDTKSAGGIAPRYQFFSACIPVFLLLIFYKDIEKSKKPVILPAIMMLVVVWGLSFGNNLREIGRFNKEIVGTFQKWQKDTNTPLVYYQPDARYSDALVWALNTGIYTSPSAYQKTNEVTGITKSR